jgi:peptide/nickel transport system permease protein
MKKPSDGASRRDEARPRPDRPFQGPGEKAVFRAHVFPNSLLSTINLFGLIVAYLLGGSVIVESVYAVPGMGKLMIDSILARDYYVVQGATLVFALTTILVMLVTDLVSSWLDPRVRP